MGKKLKLLGILTFCSALALAGCGGGGGGGGSATGGGNLTSINSGVAVDPYITEAIFEEIAADGSVLQTSNASNANGVFIFPGYLHKGSQISIQVGTGLHAGMPYQGKLMRNVDISSGKLVLNPLTTLIAEGMPAADVLALLNAITPGVVFTPADLTADPMENLSDGMMTDADKALLAANMAVHTAVEVLGGNIGSLANLTAVADVVAVVAAKLTTEVLDTLTPTSTVADLDVAAATGVTVTNYLEETVVAAADGTTDVEDVTITITPEYIDAVAVLVAANPNQPVIITDPTSEPPVQVEDTNALAQLYYKDGKDAYEAGSVSGSTAKLLTAIEKFNAAAALKDSITDAALKDQVLFFGAFAKVLQVAKPMSDSTDNGLNNFGDILDAFGLAGSVAATDRSNLNTLSLETCTTVGGITECDLALSADSPTSGELQAVLYNKVGASLTDAVEMLGQVSSTFSATVMDAGVPVQFDAADVKFISALANGMLAQINLVQAYDVNVDIGVEANRTTEQTPEQFLAANPNLGKLQDAARSAAVKTYANAAITALEGAIVALKAETDTGADQADDFVTFDNTDCIWTGSAFSCTTTYNDTAKFEETLAVAKEAINATTYDVTDDADVVVAKIDVAKFFAGVDLRSKLPSTFNKGASLDMPGLLPDPTFGGVLVQIDGQAPSVLNTDADGDGSPDFFDGMSYFVPGMFEGRTFSTWDWAGDSEWTFTFAANSTFSGSLNGQATGWNSVPFSGTYTTAKNVLTLNFTTAELPVTRLVSTLQNGYSDGENGFEVLTESFNGTESLGTTNNWLQEQVAPM